MIEVQTTDTFDSWLAKLRDRKAAAIVNGRILRVRSGLIGDVKSIGDSVSELRIDYGPGYRVYFIRKKATLILLLCAGDKSTQAADIKAAKVLAAQL